MGYGYVIWGECGLRVVLTGDFVLNLYLWETMHHTNTHTLSLSLSPCSELTALGPTYIGPQHCFSKETRRWKCMHVFPDLQILSQSHCFCGFHRLKKKREMFLYRNTFPNSKDCPNKSSEFWLMFWHDGFRSWPLAIQRSRSSKGIWHGLRGWV